MSHVNGILSTSYLYYKGKQLHPYSSGATLTLYRETQAYLKGASHLVAYIIRSIVITIVVCV